MTEENPYRFTGDADEATAPHETTPNASLGAYRRPYEPPILTPGQVRRLVFERERFAIAFVVVVGWDLLATGWTLFVPTVLANPPSRFWEQMELVRYGLWASQILFLVAAIFAYRMQHFANRSLLGGFVISLLLFVPFVRYGVAFFLMQESRVTLIRHGIRMGFFRAWPGSLPGPDAP